MSYALQYLGLGLVIGGAWEHSLPAIIVGVLVWIIGCEKSLADSRRRH